MNTETSETKVNAEPRDLLPLMRAGILLDMCVLMTTWSAALALSTGLFAWLGWWPSGWLSASIWWNAIVSAFAAAWWIVAFNIAYVLVLLALRLLFPRPQEGRYPKDAEHFDYNLLWARLTAALNNARYRAPFPGFLVFYVANLPPLVWWMGPVFGPRSRSCYAVDPNILDPHLVEIGRNVVIGYNATIGGHYQERDAWVIKRTIIEDDVVIGGHVVIYGGVHIKRGAVIGGGAIVLPNTVVGEGEFWGGVPAKKLRG